MKRIEFEGVVDTEGEMPGLLVKRRQYGVGHFLFVTIHGTGFEATRRLSRYEARRLLQGLKEIEAAWPEATPRAALAKADPTETNDG